MATVACLISGLLFGPVRGGLAGGVVLMVSSTYRAARSMAMGRLSPWRREAVSTAAKMSPVPG